MKQLILGAALVGTGIIIGALSSNTTNGTANAQFAPHPAVNLAMHCGTYQSSAKADGSYTPTTGEYVRVTWTRRVLWVNDQPPRCSKWTED